VSKPLQKGEIKKHSHEWLPDGKLKVWCESDIGDFQVTVDGNVSKEQLNEAIKAEYLKLGEQQKRVKDLGIGEIIK